METNHQADESIRGGGTPNDATSESVPLVNDLDARDIANGPAENMLDSYGFSDRAKPAARRRKILAAVGLAVAAIVAPIASLMLIGKFSMANLRRSPITTPLSSAQLRPTPRPLSVSERVILDGKIASDLRNYVWNLLPPISREEQIADKAFASVTDANYKSDETSYTTIRNEVVPHFARSIALALMVKPETEQVRVVHHLMLTSARLKEMAFEQIAAGQNDEDRMWRVGVLAEFAESSRRARLYQETIVSLARETHVKLP